MNLTGAAKVQVDVVNLSSIIKAELKGIVCVTGPTEIGIVGKPEFVGSYIEYTRKFGGLLTDTLFPELCKRALDAGASLIVSRLGHYTDPTDKTTLVGTKATDTLTVVADDVVFTAKEVGAGYNGITVTIAAAASGNAGKVDISILSPTNPSEPEVIADFSAAPTADEIANFNLRNSFVDLISYTTAIPVGVATLANGVEDRSLIVTADYIGDAAQLNGIHAFDNTVEATRIACPGVTDPALDIALVAYVETRKDMRAILSTPIGLNADGILDYREGTGAYSHTAINSWYASMYTGGLNVTSPINGLPKNIHEVGDVLGLKATKDTRQGEWFSTGGPKRGQIKNALGVVYNLGSPYLQANFDRVDNRGVNAVIEHPTYGVVVWGNGTLTKEDTLLKHENIAELVVYMRRAIKPIYESELFEPNDPVTWRSLYRKIKSLVLQPLADNRALIGGEGVGYLYQGDQDVDNVTQATLNKSVDIDAGRYRVRIFFKAVPAMKYVGVELILTNSGVEFGDVIETANP